MISVTPRLIDTVRGYFVARRDGKAEKYYADRVDIIKAGLISDDVNEISESVREVIFFDLIGYDTSFSEFGILELMSHNDFSAKLVGYTASTQIWKADSPVVLMATNRIQRDLTSTSFHYADFALSSFSRYLSPSLAKNLAPEVIALMSSTKTFVRQKAIITFYHVCLKYPEALKVGFSILRSCLSDDNKSIVFTTLTVMNEICSHNASIFINLIPKFYKMITSVTSNWILLRLISLLKKIALSEPRLPKKLAGPFQTVIETTSSVSVVFECVRAMLEIPIPDNKLFTIAVQKIEQYLTHPEPNLRFLCMQIFVELIKVEPNLVAGHKDLISGSLDSPDEATKLLALDLLVALANEENIDSIVGKFFIQFKKSTSLQFRNLILTKTIKLCASENYNLITDFDWYINVLFDFVEEGEFTCYDILATQFLDLVRRVPSTRDHLVESCTTIFSKPNFRDATELLLASSHIVAEYSKNSLPIKNVLQPVIANCTERVQASCVDTAFRLYLRASDEEEFSAMETLFDLRLPLFCSSTFPEVYGRAFSVQKIINILRKDHQSYTFRNIQKSLATEEDAIMKEDLKKPEGFDDPIPLFEEDKEEIEREKAAEVARITQEEMISDDEKIYGLKKSRRRKQDTTKEKVVILDADSLFAEKDKNSTTNKVNKFLESGLASVKIDDDEDDTPKQPQIEKKEEIPQKIEKEEEKPMPKLRSRKPGNKLAEALASSATETDKEVHVLESTEYTLKKRRRHHHHNNDEKKEIKEEGTSENTNDGNNI